jgi:hypothetical protein
MGSTVSMVVDAPEVANIVSQNSGMSNKQAFDLIQKRKRYRELKQHKGGLNPFTVMKNSKEVSELENELRKYNGLLSMYEPHYQQEHEHEHEQMEQMEQISRRLDDIENYLASSTL